MSKNMTNKLPFSAIFAFTTALLLFISLGARAEDDAFTHTDLVPTAESSDRSALMVLGDSISAGYGIQEDQGWVQLLGRTLTERELSWDIINASISGETTSGGLARLPDLLDTHTPDVLIIELGGNDGLRGYPTNLMQENIENMVSMAREAGAIPILMAMRIPPNYGPRYTQAFEQVYRTVADELEVLYVPFFLEEIAVQEGMMQDDGIHPTAPAQPLMRDFVWPYLAPFFKDS